VKTALLQLNSTVGDLDGNARRIRDSVRKARADQVDLAVAPELSLLGYPPRDLLLDRGFIARSWDVLRALAVELTGGPPVLVGVATPNSAPTGRPLFNTATLLRDGQVVHCYHKRLLPTYDVFDEDRYFEPAPAPTILELGGYRIGISICEDVWNDRDFWSRPRYHVDPVEELCEAGIHCLLNLSASPFVVGKQMLRERMLASLAAKHRVPLVYVNQVGGNDDLVFDGRSCAFDAGGRMIARGRAFTEDVIVVDLETLQGPIAPDNFVPESEVFQALVLGTQDYVRKCGFRQVLLGLSGGIDSAVTAVVAAEAVGAGNVLTVLMPSLHSSRGSIEDAEAVARALGVRTVTLPIADIMKAFDDTLREAFVGRNADVTEENIQSRIRGNLLMALSNKYGAILLTTGNKSELAVGYCTIYGDMSGGLAVISDVPKTMIYRVARWLNQRRGVIPEAILAKAPSAELRPNQTDQDSLPPYEILDDILQRHIEDHQSAADLVVAGFDEAVVRKVLKLVRTAEFKRRQAAPGLKVTDRAFGIGWRMPIAGKDWEVRSGHTAGTSAAC